MFSTDAQQSWVGIAVWSSYQLDPHCDAYFTARGLNAEEYACSGVQISGSFPTHIHFVG
ncbi:MAG: hypothetical protein K2X47_08585 [Bdellovibrionales bacterium]|nr:hypothetical protein [Bdellovibrionales bacterium]